MMSPRTRLGLAVAGLILLAVLAFVLWRSSLGRIWLDPEVLEGLVDRVGPWGPLVVVAAEALQVILAPIPGQGVGLTAGYMYGTGLGMLLCTIGLLIGTYIAMWLSRVLGRPLVERFVSPERLARIDDYTERRGPLAFFIIFLLPFLPDDVTCLLAGLSPLPLHSLLLLALVGRSPGLYASVWLGSHAQGLSWRQLILLGVISLALGLLLALYGERLEKAMFRLLDRIDFS